jgi:hypothetical protein
LLNLKSWQICCTQKVTNSFAMWRLVGLTCYFWRNGYTQNSALSKLLKSCWECKIWCCREEPKFYVWCGGDFGDAMYSSNAWVCSCLDKGCAGRDVFVCDFVEAVKMAQ